jgi:hypothetical protein
MFLVASCSTEKAPATSQRADPVHLAIEGRSNANPSIAANGDFVAVSWSASTSNATDVYTATSRDGGRSFGAPVRVNDIPGDARINSELPPRVVFVPGSTGDPDIVVVWSTKRGDTTSLQWARSDDGGATFSRAAFVPGTNARGARGWQSVAVDSTGRELERWLAHRDVPPMTAEHHHGSGAATSSKAADDATARAALSKLYFAALTDRAPTVITNSVCYCCKTSLVTKGANVYAAWRHVYPGSARNIAFTMSRDGGRTFAPPVKVSDDHWKIDGCPENGPALAVDDAHRAYVVWVTPPDGNSDTPLGIFYASADSAMRFHPRVAMPNRGPAAHAQIVVAPDGRLVAAWDEIVDGRRQVGLARLMPRDDGTAAIDRMESGAEGETGWPVLAATPARVLVGWVSRNGPKSEIVVSSLR